MMKRSSAVPKPNSLAYWVDRRLFHILLITWLLVTALVVLALLAYYLTDRAYSESLSRAQNLETITLDLDNDVIAEVLHTRSYLISGDDASLTRRRLAHEDVERDLAEIAKIQNDFFQNQLASLSDLVALHQQYDDVADQMIGLRQSGQQAELSETFFSDSDPLVSAVQDASRSLQGEVQEQLMQVSSRYSQNANIVIVGVVVLFLAGTTLGIILLMQNVSPALKTLGSVENALIDAAATQVYSPLSITQEKGASAPVVQAYNQLTNRLNSSTNTILQYVSYLHHEINSLLASVVGYGFMLAEAAPGAEENNPVEYGRVILLQSRRITQLVEDFTLAAKLEGNQFRPALIPVRLNALLKLLVEEITEDCEREGIKRDIRLVGKSQPVIVLGDALSLESAIRKVIDNAIKYSQPGTPVTVSLEVCSTPSCVRIVIEDQGMGMGEDEMHGLYQPFYRIKNDSTRRIPGNGMGLFLASAIIQIHHGQIFARSQPGKGSTFTITMPLEK